MVDIGGVAQPQLENPVGETWPTCQMEILLKERGEDWASEVLVQAFGADGDEVLFIVQFIYIISCNCYGLGRSKCGLWSNTPTPSPPMHHFIS